MDYAKRKTGQYAAAKAFLQVGVAVPTGAAMARDSSTALVQYLQVEFPGTRVYESTREAEEWPLMRCFRIEDRRNTHLLIVASELFAAKSDAKLRELLEESDVADYLFRAEGSPVLLTETGPSVVE